MAARCMPESKSLGGPHNANARISRDARGVSIATRPGVTEERGPEAFSVTLRVNGAFQALEIEPRVTLLDALRERLRLTGAKKGCDHGQCGPARSWSMVVG